MSNYEPNFDMSSFTSNNNFFGATLLGPPSTWKRIGWSRRIGRPSHSYNAYKRRQKEFGDCMTFLHEGYGIDMIEFGDRQVEVNLLFYIKKQHEADLDN